MFDEADEDRSTRLPVPRRDRFWGHAWHRQSIPHVGLVDLEYSDLSDRAFLDEFFESVAKEEKPQENLVYWRRNFRDNAALTGLFSFRVDDFRSTTERLPEGKAFLLQEPVWKTGLYTDVQLEAARLRVRPDEAFGVPERDFERFDVAHEWSYPMGLAPYVQARPFAFARYTYYDELLDTNRGDDERTSLGAGATVSQEWSRIFALEKGSAWSRFLGAEQVKHVIVPRVAYLNLFENTLDPGATIPVDDVDTVNREESVAVSLTNYLLARRRHGQRRVRVPSILGEDDRWFSADEYRTRSIFESEVSFVAFPQARRDNNDDRTSVLLFDNTAYLGNNLSARAWFEIDPNDDFHGERFAGALSYTSDRFLFTIGDRLSRRQSNVGYAYAWCQVGEKWFFEGYYARDFEDRRDVEIRASVSRRFRRLVLSFEYEEDVGEDRNRTFLVNLSPLELFLARRTNGRSRR